MTWQLVLPIRPFAAVFLALLAAGCASSDQEEALAALKSSGLEECLSQAHWMAVTRSGAVTFDPTSQGTGFVDFEVRESSDPRAYLYAVELVGAAKPLLNRPASDFMPDYMKAGSPVGIGPKLPRDRLVGRNMLNLEGRSGRGSLRGVAKGWLSQENNLVCATDSLDGRYFIIASFEPAFPVSVRQPPGT